MLFCYSHCHDPESLGVYLFFFFPKQFYSSWLGQLWQLAISHPPCTILLTEGALAI